MMGKSGKTGSGKPALTGIANAMTRGKKSEAAKTALTKNMAKKKTKKGL